MRLREIKRNVAQFITGHRGAKDIKVVDPVNGIISFKVKMPIKAEDWRGFYGKAGKLQPLSAAAIVEEFLESRESEKYEDGVRYFFGHRIPD